MININPETLEITCPSGDTGLFKLKITDTDGNPLPPMQDAVAVFAVAQVVNNRGAYANVAARPVDIVDNAAVIWLPNSLTKSITPGGTYKWDIRIVINPDLDDNGNVKALDDSDEVHSLFAGRSGGMPTFNVPGVAVDV